MNTDSGHYHSRISYNWNLELEIEEACFWIYLFALCPYWGIHRKMKLKKCIVGRPGYFDMVNKTKQNKIKLKKQ